MMKTVEKKEKQVPEQTQAEVSQTLNEAAALIYQANNEDKKRKKSKIFIIVALVLLFVLALVFSTIFSLLNINSDKIINGVSIYSVDVSGLTIEDAKAKINEYIDGKSDKLITLNHGDFSGTVTLSQLNITFDVEKAVNQAYSLGRDGNFFANNYKIFNTLMSNVDIMPEIKTDDDIFESLVISLNQNLPDAFMDPSYYIDGTKLIITNGKDGVTTDKEKLFELLLQSFDKTLDEEIVIETPVTLVKAKTINIDEIYSEVYKDPTDAYFLTDPYIVYPSSTGLDFKISIEEAKEIVSNTAEEYEIPLKRLYPSVSTSDIGLEAFPDLLSDFSTSFSSSNSNRSTNISLAASKIDGVVLMPGETFSYNQTVGQRTTAAGFKSAPAYLNGEVVQEVGGGICQVSSTLYNAVLYANLEITERQNHTFKPTYVKPGLDATVSWGGPDFKFTNNRDYPIKIVTNTAGKNVHIYIYGLKRITDYKVTLDAQYLSTVSPKTVYRYTSSLATGAKRTISSGSNGCRTATYKILYDLDGNFVSKEKISSDVYSAHDRVVEVGR